MQVNFTEDQSYCDFLKGKLRVFNNENSPHHLESRKEGAVKYVHLREDTDGAFAAGAAARIYWRMMFLDTLFVEPTHRKTGVGQKLLTRIIEIANDHDCRFIALETFGFQAKGFYEKFGFTVVGALEDYPPGETYYTMRLNL